MSITRTTLLAGPAAAIYRGHTFFAREGILVTPALELSVVDSDAQGALDATASVDPVTIRFTPSASFADLIALYPWLDGKPGASLFGADDSSLVLVAANGVRLSFASVAVIAMPDLVLGASGPVAGAVTFIALGARTLPVTAENRLVTIDTAEVPSPSIGTPQLNDDFIVTWGGAPWANLRSQDGIKVRFTMATRPVLSDANAVLDLTLERLEVEVRFTPATTDGPGEESLVDSLRLQGAEALPGRALSVTAQPLSITGDSLGVTLPLAQLVSGSLAFSVSQARLQEVVFRSVWSSFQPLLVLTEGAPSI